VEVSVENSLLPVASKVRSICHWPVGTPLASTGLASALVTSLPEMTEGASRYLLPWASQVAR
jgi:hypothetical protein